MCFILHTDATSLNTTSKFRVCHPSSVEIVWNSWQRSKPRTIAWLTFPSTKRPPTQAAISISLSCCFCWLLASANDFPGRNSKTIQKPKEYQELNVLRAPLCADGLAGAEDSLEIALCVCVYIYIYIVASFQTSQAIPSSSGQNMQTLTNPDSGHPEDEGNAAWGGDGREGRQHDNACWHMDVSQNSGTRKSSILTGFSIINHPFWGTPILGNTHMLIRLNFSFHRIYKTTRPRWIWLLLGRLHRRCGIRKNNPFGYENAVVGNLNISRKSHPHRSHVLRCIYLHLNIYHKTSTNVGKYIYIHIIHGWYGTRR